MGWSFRPANSNAEIHVAPRDTTDFEVLYEDVTLNNVMGSQVGAGEGKQERKADETQDLVTSKVTMYGPHMPGAGFAPEHPQVIAWRREVERRGKGFRWTCAKGKARHRWLASEPGRAATRAWHSRVNDMRDVGCIHVHGEGRLWVNDDSQWIALYQGQLRRNRVKVIGRPRAKVSVMVDSGLGQEMMNENDPGSGCPCGLGHDLERPTGLGQDASALLTRAGPSTQEYHELHA